MMIPTNNAVTTRTQTFWPGGDGIIRCKVLKDAIITAEDARENIEVYAVMTGHKQIPLLIDATEIKSVSREARILYGGEINARCINACAVITNSSASRIIGNFFLGLNKTLYPIKLFQSEEAAVEWLQKFVTKVS